MNNDQLQEAITQTCDAIQASIVSDMRFSKYENMLAVHLKYLLELQRTSLSYVDAGKIIWSERSNHE